MLMALTEDTDIRLIRTLRKRWPNRNDRAAALGLTTRQLTRWELDGDIPQIVRRLIEHGVVVIADEADDIAA